MCIAAGDDLEEFDIDQSLDLDPLEPETSPDNQKARQLELLSFF
jgi:hypothetical protein